REEAGSRVHRGRNGTSGPPHGPRWRHHLGRGRQGREQEGSASGCGRGGQRYAGRDWRHDAAAAAGARSTQVVSWLLAVGQGLAKRTAARGSPGSRFSCAAGAVWEGRTAPGTETGPLQVERPGVFGGG